MSHTKIMIHAVWGTKWKHPFLTKELKPLIIDHIKVNARSKGIHIDEINGHLDHMHCLFDLDPKMSLANALQLLKGESSYWTNQEQLTSSKFEWAAEYFAVSVSPSNLEIVRRYIRNQEEHHAKMTFQEEIDSMIEENGLADETHDIEKELQKKATTTPIMNPGIPSPSGG